MKTQVKVKRRIDGVALKNLPPRISNVPREAMINSRACNEWVFEDYRGLDCAGRQRAVSCVGVRRKRSKLL
jgi:hypothetical protein